MTTLERPRKSKMVGAPRRVQDQPRIVELAAAATITHEMIARRAYEIWERKGRPEGQCEQNWQEAERELRAKR